MISPRPAPFWHGGSHSRRSSVPLKDKIQVRYLSVIVDICGDVPDITIAPCGVFVDNGPVRLRSCAHKLPNVNVDVLVCFHCSLLLWYAYPHRRVSSKRFLFPHDSLCQRVVSSGNVLTYPPMERLKNGTAYRSASCRPAPGTTARWRRPRRPTGRTSPPDCSRRAWGGWRRRGPPLRGK